MKSHRVTAAFLVCAAAAHATAAEPAKAAAEIINPAGEVIGKAAFEQTPSGVLIRVVVSGLTPGAHGIHLHTAGACSPDFGAAKGHINPYGKAHGLRHPDGPDNGDLPNLIASADGHADAEFFTTLVTVAGGSQPALLDDDGSAVIIHEHADDHITQPIGGAGGRVACGVVEAV
ncbi:MAG: superoxide dismutase family protein [Gammaproteobacteria bacterium]|nr:superoxide dismutase family protein [Gammaproteobacteria bacterium]